MSVRASNRHRKNGVVPRQPLRSGLSPSRGSRTLVQDVPPPQRRSLAKPLLFYRQPSLAATAKFRETYATDRKIVRTYGRPIGRLRAARFITASYCKTWVRSGAALVGRSVPVLHDRRLTGRSTLSPYVISDLFSLRRFRDLSLKGGPYPTQCDHDQVGFFSCELSLAASRTGLAKSSIPATPFGRLPSSLSDSRMRPSLDIIIVNWNTGDALRHCLSSIEAMDTTSFDLGKVVVVDNASSDTSLQSLETYQSASNPDPQ